MLQDKHVWVGYDSFEGERIYLPVGTWNGKNHLKQNKTSMGNFKIIC